VHDPEFATRRSTGLLSRALSKRDPVHSKSNRSRAKQPRSLRSRAGLILFTNKNVSIGDSVQFARTGSIERARL
jgi:hypothetical protein